MKEISYEEMNGIRDFKNDLIDCFSNKLQKGTELEKSVMDSVIKIIDIHYHLAELAFDVWADKMAKVMQKEVKNGLCNR